MKKILTASVLLNLILLGGWFFLRREPPKPLVPSAAPVQAASVPAPVVAVPAEQTPPRAEPAPFHWHQLDAPDYHDYVKNLRAVGCPEVSVRAIVAADVQAIYDERARALEQQISALENGSWSTQFSASQTNAALKAELLDLPRQETELIADLLGLKPTPAEVAATEAPAAESASNRPRPAPADQDQPATPPMAFQGVDLSALNLTADQQQVIDTIRQNFVQQIGGTNQDPNDPAYLARWQKAQPVADNMLRGMLGNRVYEQYQMAQLKDAVNPNQQASTP